jgi:hypothetical protein
LKRSRKKTEQISVFNKKFASVDHTLAIFPIIFSSWHRSQIHANDFQLDRDRDFDWTTRRGRTSLSKEGSDSILIIILVKHNPHSL